MCVKHTNAFVLYFCTYQANMYKDVFKNACSFKILQKYHSITMLFYKYEKFLGVVSFNRNSPHHENIITLCLYVQDIC